MKYAILTIHSHLTSQKITNKLKDIRGLSTGKLVLVPDAWLPSANICKEVISRIPREIKHLMLHRNLVQQLSATEIADVYGAIPQTVTSIHHGYDFNAPPNFSRPIFNEVEDFYLKMLNSIPSHVRAVGFYNLDVPPGSKLALLGLLAAIPKHVNSLSLIDFNPQMQGNDLEEVFSKIPSHVKTLELAFSNYTNNVQENINAIQAIPSHVTTLKFAGKGIGHVKQLIEFIKQVPNKITTLDLSGYRLTDMSEEELSQLFSKIPESITTVNLTDSMGFRPFQPNHVRALSNIPPHVKNIILGPLIVTKRDSVNWYRTYPRVLEHLI